MPVRIYIVLTVLQAIFLDFFLQLVISDLSLLEFGLFRLLSFAFGSSLHLFALDSLLCGREI